MEHINNKNEFENLIQSNPNVIIDFFATWCGPCKMLSPIIEEIAEEQKGKVVIAKVDVDQAGDVASLFGIQSIPTVIYFKDGKALKVELGFKPKEKIIANINELYN